MSESIQLKYHITFTFTIQFNIQLLSLQNGWEYTESAVFSDFETFRKMWDNQKCQTNAKKVQILEF